MMKAIKFTLQYAAGLVSGLVLAWGWGVLRGRSGPPGGEMLLLPLMALLVLLGYQLHGLVQTKDRRR